MIRGIGAAFILAVAGGAAAAETLAVVAVADPPGGPDVDLAEAAHQLRAACRDRIGGVEDVPTMRARMLGQGSSSTVSELDRAYGGALAVYQNGEFESSVRTLRAIVGDLEALPESEEAYSQWVRAQFRLAHAEITVGREREADAALMDLARTDLGLQADAEQYSPTYRRRFEQVKARVRALPARRLTVAGEGMPGSVFVNGRRVGTTPLAISLPAGRYRIGGAAGGLRVPSVTVDLERESRSILLDFALADSLRANAGPGLALAPARRGDGIVRAGAWLGADRVIAVSRVHEGQAQFLLGSIYDVRRGALLREGSVRMVAGTVPSVNLGALASFLLTGQSSRDVKDRTAEARVPPVADAARPDAARGAGQRSRGERAVESPSADPSTTSTALAVPTPTPTSISTARATSTPTTRATPTPIPTPTTTATPAVTSTPAATTKATPTATRAGAETRASTRASAPAVATRAAATAPEPIATARPVAPEAATADPGGAAVARARLAVAPPAEEAARREAMAAGERQEPADGSSGTGKRRWMRRGAIAAGIFAGGFTAIAIQQAFASRGAYRDADAMIGPGDQFLPGQDPARYDDLRRDGAASARNAWISAGAAAGFAAAAGVLGWASQDRARGAPLAFRF